MTRKEMKKRADEQAKSLGYGGVYRSSRERRQIQEDVDEQKRASGMWQQVEEKTNEFISNNNNWKQTTAGRFANFASKTARTVGFATQAGSMLLNRANETIKNLEDAEKNKERDTALKRMLPTTPTSMLTNNLNVLTDKDKGIKEKLLGFGKTALETIPRCTTN